jgi:septal ring factor EnvC (AmiA/AmiB activator)
MYTQELEKSEKKVAKLATQLRLAQSEIKLLTKSNKTISEKLQRSQKRKGSLQEKIVLLEKESKKNSSPHCYPSSKL